MSEATALRTSAAPCEPETASSSPRLVHDVRFYETEAHLADLTAGFLAAGLAQGQAAVAILAEPHREPVLAGLAERGFDLEALDACGRLRTLDARATLAAFMRDGMPDADRFDAVVASEIDRASRLGKGPVCAFGEMVDLLWRDGNPPAALRLEELWNGLRERQRLNLLCAYTMTNFPSPEDADGFLDVCRAHDHAAPTETFLRIDGVEDRDREIAALQQRSLALAHEIEARRAAEARLRESERRLRHLVELLPAALYTCDRDGRIDYYNPKASELWGRSPELGDPDHRFCGALRLQHPDGSPLRHEDTPMALTLREGRPCRNEDVIIERPDGSRVFVRVNIDPIRDSEGQVAGAINVFTDVTEERRSDELRARLAAIVESTHDAVIGLDLAGTITSWNPGAAALYGYAAEEVISRPSSILVPEDHADDFPMLVAALQRGERIEHYETVRLAKDGRRIDVALTVSPIRDARGAIVGASKIARDIGEHKRAEAALREADRRKDEFLATLAHELRNPLAPMRNGLELLALAPHDEEVLRDAREMMRRQLDHAVRLVDDLLDLSRISRDKLQLRKGRFHLRHLVDCALETSRPFLDARRHRVCVRCPEEPILLEADATRVTQVLANLLNNAAKFTPSGGHIEVDVRVEEEQAVVAVRDYGIGIEPEMLSRVFDMFAQAAAVKEEAIGGLGIGLTLARRLVEMHGGSIRAESPGAGCGSTFTVRLPRLIGQDCPATPPPRRVASGCAPLSIVVADDNVDAAESLARLLRMSGHDVRVAHDGEQAIHAVRAFCPSVVILDVGMPRLNGCEAARRIREMSSGNCPTLIAVTGWGQASDRRRTREAGFDLHLVKPIDFHALKEALARTPA